MRIDARSQVQGILPRVFGGTDNVYGAGNKWTLIQRVNDFGSTLAIGTLVNIDNGVYKTTTLGEKIAGVVVGSYDSEGRFQDVAPVASANMAIAISGIVPVLVTAAATRGYYLVASNTDGKADPYSTVQPGTFGHVVENVSSTLCYALIGTLAASASGVTDHGALTGLADDDHSAYATVTAGGGETVSTVAATGSTETANPAAANVFDWTLTADCTITLTSPSAGVSCGITLILRQDSTGSRLVTWPGSVVWPGGSAPTLLTAASSVDVITLFTIDGGTTWYGFQATGSSSLTSASSGGPLLISDDHSTPILFADLLLTEEGDDLLYADSW